MHVLTSWGAVCVLISGGVCVYPDFSGGEEGGGRNEFSKIYARQPNRIWGVSGEGGAKFMVGGSRIYRGAGGSDMAKPNMGVACCTLGAE